MSKVRQRKEHLIFKTLGMYSNEEQENFKKDVQANHLEDNEEELDEDELYERMSDDTNLFYNDEKTLLNKTLDGNIFCIADLGLWNGRRQGFKRMGNNLNEVLSSISCDEFKVYVDGYGNIKSEGYHHDGHNMVEYREIRQGRDIDKLIEKIEGGEQITRYTLNFYTKSLGHYIKEIYGY